MPRWTLSGKNILWSVLLTVLGIACFPVNPLVLTGLVDPGYSRAAYIIGWPVWALGMMLITAPIIIFPRKGGVEKGKAFVHTTRLVDSGIYGIVRHPQYLGGILALFVTTLLWYPHWLFAALGAAGTAAVYMSCRVEDRLMLEKFGDAYREYMERVPRLNLALGLIRFLRRKREER
jgi:protein-S-isoprenylcysteine O-methyltransferase Ste14